MWCCLILNHIIGHLGQYSLQTTALGLRLFLALSVGEFPIWRYLGMNDVKGKSRQLHCTLGKESPNNLRWGRFHSAVVACNWERVSSFLIVKSLLTNWSLNAFCPRQLHWVRNGPFPSPKNEPNPEPHLRKRPTPPVFPAQLLSVSTSPGRGRL